MKRRSYMLGGWVDETVPRDEIAPLVEPLGIDAAEFCAWLAPVIGRYRSWTEVGQQMPTRNEEIEVLRDYQKTMEAAIHYLMPGGLPPRADAAMNQEMWNFRKASLCNVERQIADNLRYLMVMAGNVEREFKAKTQRRGKKADPRKAELLSSVSTWLSQKGVAAAKARATTARVLTLCGIEGMPDTKTTLRRAARRGTQLQGN